ncbi:MAG TPA: NADH-quinone oxidoreductase subunit L [Planctomycetaceae bacterium]|nr:NADH-quinone oxidoreductase subunit L [Planctomycetaceae bacterium]
MLDFLNENVLWIIPAAPLLACLWIVVAGQFFRRDLAHRPVVVALTVSCLAAYYLLFAVVPKTFDPALYATEEEAVAAHDEHAAVPGPPGGAVKFVVYEWFRVGMLNIPVQLRADAMAALMLVMVTTVSLLVAIFASGYMHGDPGYPRFFAEIALFVFSMCMLVLAGNFLLLFVFWEAVGLCSYLLIGFWFRKPSAAAAAKKAFVVNRIGDFGLMMGIFLIWTTFGTLDFEYLFASGGLVAHIVHEQPELMTTICLLLFVGAVGKSAQFPLHVWLPDAMEGPTPVSALIHAATMVTAGVYLVARCTPFFVHAPTAQLVVSGVGAATALIAAITALTQYDLKRVLAYSTVSQLGYMFMSLGAGAADPGHLMQPAVTFAMFHMFTHAFFKAVLFLSAGSVMHAMGDVIDMRRFSGLKDALPITHRTFLAGSLALAGFPLMAGFWSKDEIISVLHAASRSPEHGGFFTIILAVALLTSLMTAFYTFRAYFLTFHGPERFPEEAGHHPHDAPPAMAGPLYVLAFCAVFIGLVTGPTHLYAGYLHHTPGLPGAPAHGIDWLMMGVSILLALGGIAAAWMVYCRGATAPAPDAPLNPLQALSYNGLYLNQLYLAVVVRPLQMVSKLAEDFDRGVIDRLVDAVGLVPNLVSSTLRPFQNGLVQNYAFIMLLGVAASLLWMLRTFAG